MSVQVLSDKRRRARKTYRCGMCDSLIRVGDTYRAASCVYDDRVYDWRDCLPCDSTGVLSYVSDWAGHPDEGVAVDSACEWAEEVLQWSRRGGERRAARAWLARVCGGEGE